MNSHTFPQVLFLSNGLNLAFSGISWSDLIGKIAKRNDFDWSRSEMPMPLQAILASDNQIRTSLKTAKENFRGKIRTEQHRDIFTLVSETSFSQYRYYFTRTWFPLKKIGVLGAECIDSKSEDFRFQIYP